MGANGNFTVLGDDPRDDLAKGFEIRAPDPVFVSWDTSLGELRENPHVRGSATPSEVNEARLEYPVRLGNLVVDDVRIPLGNTPRLDLPPVAFLCELRAGKGGDASFFASKQCFRRMIDGKPDGYERKDQNHLVFAANGIQYELTYWYQTRYWSDQGYTSLVIKNLRDYPAGYDLGEYGSRLSLDVVVPIAGETVRVCGDYRYDPGIKARPSALARPFGDTAVVWLDRKNGRVGFSAGRFCKLLPLALVASLGVQNTLPAKGGGSSSLFWLSKEGAGRQDILMAGCHDFDPCLDALKQLGIAVELAPDEYDC